MSPYIELDPSFPMRLLIPCMKCLQELERPDEWFGRVEFRDDGCYEVVCRRGHSTVTLLQEEKYEVLFEIGVNAILDGYYREAVASFAASLERFRILDLCSAGRAEGGARAGSSRLEARILAVGAPAWRIHISMAQ